MKLYLIVPSILILLSVHIQPCFAIASSSHSNVKEINKPNKALIVNFMQAMHDVYQPEMTNTDVDNLYAFMSDDFEDHHVSYNVVQSGKEGKQRARAGLLKKGKNSIAYKNQIENITLGSDTAVVTYTEDAKYIKNGKKKHFLGRTILVLEFDKKGKISVMRRYMD